MGEADRVDTDEFRIDYEALHRRDWDRAQRLHHPEIEWHDPPESPDAQIHRGREAVRQGVYEAIFDAVGEWGIEPLDFIRAGEKLLVECKMWIGARYTGIRFETDLFQVWTFQDGLAIRQQAFLQRERALEAAGLTK
jgi:ketosteroid isomerase-like protein